MRSNHIILLFIGISLSISDVQAWGPPHDNSNNINCVNCHQASHGAGYGILPHGAGQTAVCLSCHNPSGQAATMTQVGTEIHGGGTMVVECGACHDVHDAMQSTDAHNGNNVANNLKLIRNDPDKYIASANTEMVFQSKPDNFAFTSAPYNGVCQTCHTTTAYARKDGTNPHHQGDADCVGCHLHGSSFAPSGGSCKSCHDRPRGTGGYRRQIVEDATGSGGDFSGSTGGGGTYAVAENFAVVSYSNNDGTANWVGNWIDPEDSSPSAGKVQIPVTSAWVQLTYDDFESGWGNYTDGGGDCTRYTGGTYAHQGNAAADIQDNSGTASSFTLTNAIDVNGPGYTQIKVEFWFRGQSMETGEDFWLQYYDGSSWQTIKTWARGSTANGATSFNNGTFYQESVIIPEATYTFPTNMQIRFRCDASGNGDDVYIDEVRISAYDPGSGGGELRLAGPPNGGDRPSAAREVDLSGNPSSVTLTFDYRTDTGVDAADALIVEASNNGGASYATVDTITNITGASSGSKNYNLLSYAANNTRIRFRISSDYASANEFIYLDNVQIQYVVPPPSGSGGINNFHHVTDNPAGSGNETVTDDDCIVCHDQSNHRSNTEPVVLLNDPDGGTGHSYNGTGASLENFCRNCHDSGGPTAYGSQPFADNRTPTDISTPWAASSHNSALTSEACLSCHGGADTTRTGLSFSQNVHGSNNESMLSSLVAGETVANTEEGVCFACHDSDGPAGTNLETDFAKTHGHPVDDSKQSGGRSVECIDCHNAHGATGGAHTYTATPNSTRNQISAALARVSGVQFTYGGIGNFANPASGLSAINPSTKEYQICFKCHSSYDSGISANSGDDRAQEFNPNNASYHPVMATANAGSTTALQDAQLNALWSTNRGNQTMMCSDCHNTDAATPAAQGPHGSAVSFMLRGPKTLWPPTATGTSSTVYNTSFCSNCHTYTTNNKVHEEHDHRTIRCYNCHILVPHGGKLGRLIGDRETMPARYAYQGDLNNMYVHNFRKQSSYNNYKKEDCGTSCTGEHNFNNGSNW